MLTTEATAGNILYLAARLAGLGATGRPLAQEVETDALALCNGMLDAWAMDGQTIYNVDITVYALTSGQQSYDVGPAAASPFNITRPSRIHNANLVYSTQNPPTRVPLQILDDDGWMSIAVRAISGPPTAVYYSPSNPTGVLNFYPIPTAGFSVELELWTQISQFASTSDTFIFPPGYFEAIYQNLAVRLCTPMFGLTECPQAVREMAAASLARISKLNNIPSPQMRADGGTNGVRNDDSGYRNLYNPSPIWTRT